MADQVTAWLDESWERHEDTDAVAKRGGHIAFAIMALDEGHVAYLERFSRFLTERGLDLAE